MSGVNFLEKLLDGVEVEWRPLGEVTHMRAGQHISASSIMEQASSEYPYPCFGGNGIRGFVAAHSHAGKYLLIGRQGALCGNVKRTNGKFYATEHAVVVTPSESINIDWAFHLLKQMNLNQYASQSAQPGLAVGKIEILKVPLPCPNNPKKSLEIQGEIVRILDKFTSLAAELTAELTARKKQYNYYRDRLLNFTTPPFGHPSKGWEFKFNAENSPSLKGWQAKPDGVVEVEWKPLGEIGEFIRGKRFTKADFVEDGIPVIHYGEIYTRYGVFADQAFSRVRSDMEKSLRYAQPGDVVLTDVGETVEDVGKAVAWIGKEKVAIHDHCYAFRHAMNPKFVSYCMQTASFISEKAKYVARTKVNTLLIAGFSKISIPVPSLEEQARIVAILDKFDALTNSLTEGLPREIELRQKQYVYYRDLLLSFDHPALSGTPPMEGNNDCALPFPSSGGVAGEA